MLTLIRVFLIVMSLIFGITFVFDYFKPTKKGPERINLVLVILIFYFFLVAAYVWNFNAIGP